MMYYIYYLQKLTLRQFALFNVTGAILIVGLKHLQPLIYVVVELLEFIDVDGARSVVIEHAYKEGST